MSVADVQGGNQSTSNILNSIAGIAATLGQAQYGWAQQQFAASSALTGQVVNNYLAASQQAMTLANNNLQRYTQIFQPLENQLVQDANSYASPARIALNMGAAESATGQAMDQGRINAEQQLQSYGIDPSSGRYAELEQAQDAQKAAAQAGAGQTSELATEATGRQLRSQAIQVGQQYPGQMVNALNSAIQSLGGAENATLSNINTGVNAFNSANSFLDTGMANKFQPYPPRTGTTLNTTQPQKSSGGGGGGSGGGGGYGSMGNTQAAGMGNDAFRHYPSNPAILTLNGDYNNSDYNVPSSNFGTTTDEFGNQSFQDPTQSIDTSGGYGMDQNLQGGTDSLGGAYDPNAAFNSYDNYSGWGDTSTPSQDFSSTDNYGYSGGGFDGTQNPDMSSYADTNNNYNSSDYSNYSDTSGGDYARGGDVGAIPTPGGRVPPQASPSGGQRSDDVKANLTAHEFVVPRDVSLWKGEEFFQKLIQQSRKARMSAPAAGQPGPPVRGTPAFTSRPTR